MAKMWLMSNMDRLKLLERNVSKFSQLDVPEARASLILPPNQT